MKAGVHKEGRGERYRLSDRENKKAGSNHIF
jgi:hypothetical protein